MRPDDRELDEEIRGHLALSVKERIERGDDPETARLGALREFGYVPAIRESMRRIWYSRLFDAAGAQGREMRIGLRSLLRAKGLAATVVVTLALGIGANAAIFSVVRQVLLRPLVNRDEDRLIYIRQSAAGRGADNVTFSVPELNDLRSRVNSVAAFADFSTIDFTMIGFGPPRVVKAGVVGGSYFDVMGLRAILGRLLDASDDGADALPAVVLTYRFWSTSLERDPNVVGRNVRLDSRTAKVVGILEPSVPYPADTEIIANVVTSPHHLGATMVTARTHRMTELFGRLAAGATLEQARTELTAAHAAMMADHPEAYAPDANMGLTATPLRTQITASARTALLLLLAAAGVVFAIACTNVANLILARTVRRERELALRAALGASTGALRRTLLGESLVLCGTGAVLGVLLARPLVTVVGLYARRFSVRALEVTVDGSLLWVGAGLSILAAVALACAPRLPSGKTPMGTALAGGGSEPPRGTNGRLRAFAITQIALSFVLLASAATLVRAFVALDRADTGYAARQVLALDVPMPLDTTRAAAIGFVQEATRRIRELPDVQHVAAGNFVPWRDSTPTLPAFPFRAERATSPEAGHHGYARVRNVSPGFFAALGIPLIEGRDFSADDRHGSEPVVIVSASVARQLNPDVSALNTRLVWTDPVFGKPQPRRVVGVVADVDDENLTPGPAPTIYHPFGQMPFGGRMFVRAAGDPYALVPALTHIVRTMSAEQPVERAATLADVRAHILAPERLNAAVVAGFAGVALVIAIVGVAGVLAFSVSARTREFGVRLAIGSTRVHLLAHVLWQGATIASIGIAVGAAASYVLARAVSITAEDAQPGAAPMFAAAAVLIVAALVASLMPAARASRVDVMQALRAE